MQVQCNPIKMSVAFFTEIEQKILKFARNYKKNSNSDNHEKEKKLRLCVQDLKSITNYDNKDSSVLA